MVVGEIAEAVDMLVVGAGPAGYAAALHGARRGRHVTLVDSDGDAGIGGVCLRAGCIPSKALIELAETVYRTTGARPPGLTGGDPTLDLGAFQDHKRSIISELTRGVRDLLTDAAVEVRSGNLRFTRPNQAVIQDGNGPATFVEFRDVVLATGSRPTALEHLTADGATVLDSTDALDLTELPTTVAIVGAGYIGVELGTALAKLGSSVTLIELKDQILPDLDPTLVRPVSRRMRDLGITLLTAARAEEHHDGVLKVHQGAQDVRIKADVVITAVGRDPNTADLGLDRLGITPHSNGLLQVADDRTVQPHVAAIGDITPGPALAHKGYAEAEVAVDALCGYRVAFDPASIPAVVFSDPEIATVGMSVAQANAEPDSTRVTTVPMRGNGRALTLQAPAGTIALVTDKFTGAVHGVHLVGPHVSELISEGTHAIEMGSTVDDLAATIHVHPTVSEQLQEAARAARGKPLHGRLAKSKKVV